MRGRTVLVTGATAGIGFFTAQGLAAKGARVLITGRDAGRGEKAVAQLRRNVGHDDLIFLAADHATVGGNQRLARRVRELVQRVDVLVNNVGGLFARRQETADGYEATLALNAVGPFVLTMALLSPLRAAGEARVVNVGSSAHKMWRRDPFDDLQATARYVGIEVHARAKLANLLWTLALTRRPEGRGLAVNATNPGMAWTPGIQALTLDAVPFWRFVWPLVRLIQRTASPRKAAASSIRLAASPDVAGVTAAYFESGGRPARPAAAALDPANQDQAWRLMSELVARAPTAIDVDPHP